MTKPPIAMTIAGSDSSGGAGIQADLKTFAALGVTAIHEVPVEVIAAQIDAILTDIGADAVKTGMLSSSAIIETVAWELKRHGVTRLVVDPVMVAKGGHFSSSDATDVFYDGKQFREFTAQRVDTKNTHGTGCTFASAIAAGLAQGLALEDAVAQAKTYVTEAIRANLEIGSGHGPLDHFYKLRKGP